MILVVLKDGYAWLLELYDVPIASKNPRHQHIYGILCKYIPNGIVDDELVAKSPRMAFEPLLIHAFKNYLAVEIGS